MYVAQFFGGKSGGRREERISKYFSRPYWFTPVTKAWLESGRREKMGVWGSMGS